MANQFQPGNVVRLKSGGPLMTVEQVGQDAAGRDRVWCKWFDKNSNPQTETFPPETIQLDDEF